MKTLFVTLFVVALWASAQMASIQTGCPGGLGVVYCFIDPCVPVVKAGCHGYPDATCVANYCGGCNVEWYDSNKNQVFCHEKTTTALPQKG